MDIYIGHSTDFDFDNELYDLLRDTELIEQHNVVFPHADSDELFDSHTFFEEDCDLVIAEVSYASTGLGIELGWADESNIPIICVYKEGTNPSGAIYAIAEDSDIYSYTGREELVKIIEKQI